MSVQPAVILRAQDGSSVRIDAFPVVLGRAHGGDVDQPDCDLSALDPQARVSRQHALLDVSNGRLLITDLESTNGTWLDGRRLEARQPTEVGATAELVLGNLPVTVELDLGEAAAEPVEATASRAGAGSRSTAVGEVERASSSSVVAEQMTAIRGRAGVEAVPDESAAQAVRGSVEVVQAEMEARAESGADADREALATAVAQAEAEAEAEAMAKAAAEADPLLGAILGQLKDASVTQVAIAPLRRIHVRRLSDWAQAADSQVVTPTAWRSLMDALSVTFEVDLSPGGYAVLPIEDGVLAELVNAPLAVEPALLVTRRPAPLGLDAMVAAGLIDAANALVLREALTSHQGVILAGPPLSGRTSLLEALIDAIPAGRRIAVVERRPAARFSTPGAVRLSAPRGSGSAAVEAAMVMAPDWMVADDLGPSAAGAIARLLRDDGCSAIVTARTTDAEAWRQRAAEVLTAFVGDIDRSRRDLEQAFPLTVHMSRSERRLTIDSIRRSS
jgi:pSer/pThr/pTyr-binding forkhead associated (FHA) protein/type IV secretory pathway ATPase VirB11/archaellum biosynthesis ATPase